MTVKRYFAEAKAKRYDSLGIGSDTESLSALVKVAKKRFFQTPNQAALDRWRELIDDLSLANTGKQVSKEWLAMQEFEHDIASILSGLRKGDLNAVPAPHGIADESVKGEIVELLSLALAHSS